MKSHCRTITFLLNAQSALQIIMVDISGKLRSNTKTTSTHTQRERSARIHRIENETELNKSIHIPLVIRFICYEKSEMVCVWVCWCCASCGSTFPTFKIWCVCRGRKDIIKRKLVHTKITFVEQRESEKKKKTENWNWSRKLPQKLVAMFWLTVDRAASWEKWKEETKQKENKLSENCKGGGEDKLKVNNWLEGRMATMGKVGKWPSVWGSEQQ